MAEVKVKKVATKRKSAKTEAAVASKLRIKVSAYEHKVLDMSVKQIVDTANRYEGEVHGPVPLPTEIKRYTVNRSSFIDKNSREQFEMRVHRRLIDIVSPSAKVIESLTNIELPSGVGIDLKMM
ncbi:MAG TPA: 30S ribosomal protein S10 [Candidatus Paceibacterota bacterium]